jgi:hypothetical protein
VARKAKASEVSEWSIGQPLSFPEKDKGAVFEIPAQQKKQSPKRERVRHRSYTRRDSHHNHRLD